MGIACAGAWAGDAPPVMMVPGQFDVSASGAATYSIPIAVPPGTAGMVPSLSLEYSSQAGDGIVGLGFSLSGLPSIGRCPRTIAQDSVHGTVSYDANDRYCLEGQRLVAVSGTYGGDGTEYRTEIEGFSKIVSHGGSTGNGPDWWEVKTKSGQTMVFGDSSSPHYARFLAVGTSKVRAWGLNKVSDTKGNYLTVNYVNDATNGQAYPDRIDYTGNTGASLTTYNSVRFTYADRSDTVPLYQAGSQLKITKRLTNIKTYDGANLVSDYRITYNTDASSTKHSRVAKVELCDASGNCLAPTTFGWQGTRDTVSFSSSTDGFYAPNGTESNLETINHNGDGLNDLALLLTPGTGCSSSSLYANDQSSAFSQTSSTVTYTSAPTGYSTGTACFYRNYTSFLDYNGDGITDILPRATSGGTTSAVLKNNGNSTFSQQGSVSNYHFTGEFDGDGRGDLFLIASTSQPLLSNGDGTFTATGSFSGLTSVSLYPADYDGNGCTDILTQGSTNKVVYFCNPASSETNVSNYGPQAIADFNGDGLADVLGANLWLSTGAGFVDKGAVPSDFSNGGTGTGDFNGDGKIDVVIFWEESEPTGTGTYFVDDYWQVYLSTGSGFVASSSGYQHATVSGFPGGISAIIGDWNNDGAADLWVKGAALGSRKYFSTFTPELVTSVSNGLGITTTFTYDRLNKHNALYTKDTAGTYPTVNLDGPYYVVSQVSSSNGIGGNYVSTYAYEGAKADHQGRGFLGFWKRRVTDSQTGIVQETTYNQTWPFIGLVASETKTLNVSGVGNVTLNSTANTFAAHDLGSGRRFVYLVQTVQESKELDGNAMPRVTTCYGAWTFNTPSTCTVGYDAAGTDSSKSYDQYGNARKITVVSADGATTTTTNTYTNYTSGGNWILGRLTSASVTKHIPGGSSDITRASAFEYDMSGTYPSGLLTREVVEPASSTLCIQTDYTYDSYGNKTAVTLGGTIGGGTVGCSNGLSSGTRTTSYTYNASGDGKARFVGTVTNALSQSETWTYDARFGLPLTQTGPNGLTTSWTYDGFGRVTLALAPDLNRVRWSYTLCDGCGLDASYMNGTPKFYVTKLVQDQYDVANGPTQYLIYDGLSRLVKVSTLAFDGSNWAVVYTQFNDRGQVLKTGRPVIWNAGAPPWTQFAYDAIGRVLTATAPDGTVTKSEYLTASNAQDSSCPASIGYDQPAFSCPKTRATADYGDSTHKNQQTVSITNPQGLAAKVIDSAGGVTTYAYDAYGNLKTLTDPAGNQTTYTYDTRGRKTAAADPDMGTWSYVYNSAGELLTQTDAKSQTSTLTYDALGRVVTRLEKDASASEKQYAAWTYGTSSGSHNVGKLIEAKACPTSACASEIAKRTATYDSLGRPAQTAISAGGTSIGSYTSAYDAAGRLEYVTYPSSYQVKYVYTSIGYLKELKDAVSGFKYWEANTVDAEGHLTQETLINGALAVTRAFDALTGRLTSVTAGGGNSVANMGFTYDRLGNLTRRSDPLTFGDESFCYDGLNRLVADKLAATINCTSDAYKHTVSYNAIGNILSKTRLDDNALLNTYSYPASGSSSVRPHAVSSVSGKVNGVVNPVYSYDANGNLSSGGGRSLQWTVFNMVECVANGATSCAGGATTKVEYTYDADHSRITQKETASSTVTTTTYLNGAGVSSEKVVTGSVTTWTDYLFAGGNRIAQRSVVVGGATTTKYYITDHLGSVAIVTDGTTHTRRSFDAWGKSRNTNGSDDYAGSIDLGHAAPTRGFTDHEHMPSVGLVNMNARVYDPELGRFLSADSVVPDILFSPALDRYGYVYNNPLTLTDPTGNCPLTAICEIVITGSWNPVIAVAGGIIGSILKAIFGGLFGAKKAAVVLYHVFATSNPVSPSIVSPSNLPHTTSFANVGCNGPCEIVITAVEESIVAANSIPIAAFESLGATLEDLAVDAEPQTVGSGQPEEILITGTRGVSDCLAFAGDECMAAIKAAKAAAKAAKKAKAKSRSSGASRGSTGRTTPKNLKEKLAMDQAQANPQAGKVLNNVQMKDPRWPASEGWVKMEQKINGVTIHYVRNTRTGAVDDFKFVD